MECNYYVCCRDGDHKGSKQVCKTNKTQLYQKPSGSHVYPRCMQLNSILENLK